jgi:hypothetical protein
LHEPPETLFLPAQWVNGEDRWGFPVQLAPRCHDSDIATLSLRVLAEPLTATLTFALAFVSAFAWEVGWLAYPLIAAVLRRGGMDLAPGAGALEDHAQVAGTQGPHPLPWDAP